MHTKLFLVYLITQCKNTTLAFLELEFKNVSKDGQTIGVLCRPKPLLSAYLFIFKHCNDFVTNAWLLILQLFKICNSLYFYFRVTEDFVGLKEQSLTNQIVTYFITNYEDIFKKDIIFSETTEISAASIGNSSHQVPTMVSSWPEVNILLI